MDALGVIVVVLVIVVILALVVMGMYNGFVKSRNLIQESWRQIDVELNRRYELIPNLIETVRAYAAHERNTLEDITRLRSQAQQISQHDGALPSQQRADVEQALSGAVRNLIVSVEAYPDLKSNQNFLELQKQLTETEDRIAAGRRFYNANVRVYNTKVESVPSNIIANTFKFEKATYFEVNDPTVRQAPSVSFGEIAYRGDPQAPGHAQPGQYQPQQGALPQQQAQPAPYEQAAQQPPYQQNPYQQNQYGQPGQVEQGGQAQAEPAQYQPQQYGNPAPSGQYNQPPQPQNQPQQYNQPQQQYGQEVQEGGYQPPVSQPSAADPQQGGYNPPVAWPSQPDQPSSPQS